MESLTIKEALIIMHASGLSRSKNQYRSHYCTKSDDPTLCKLAADGYFSGPHASEMLSPGTAMFYLTEAGIKTAKNLAAMFNSFECSCSPEPRAVDSEDWE